MGASNDSLQTYASRTVHWRLAGATYFSTWSVSPEQAALSLAERELVADALEHFHHERYRLLAYVVMDDHVHVICTPLASHELSSIVQGWKSITAHKLQREHGRLGRVWLKGYHDRIVRGEDDLLEKMQYILDNPQRRWPELGDYPYAKWFEL